MIDRRTDRDGWPLCHGRTCHRPRSGTNADSGGAAFGRRMRCQGEKLMNEKASRDHRSSDCSSSVPSGSHSYRRGHHRALLDIGWVQRRNRASNRAVTLPSTTSTSNPTGTTDPTASTEPTASQEPLRLRARRRRLVLVQDLKLRTGRPETNDSSSASTLDKPHVHRHVWRWYHVKDSSGSRAMSPPGGAVLEDVTE